MYLKSNIVWKAYTEEKQTIHELSLRYKVSESTFKRLLKNVSVEWHNPKIGGHGIVNIDATYFGRNCGVIAALDTNTSKPLYMKLLLSAKSLKRKKIRADSIKGFSPFGLFLYMQKKIK